MWYTIAGFLSGILGGMGMGGGTILIPLLSIFYKTGQHTAQAINLIGFIPMSVVALIIHFKNKLVDFKHVLMIILPGVFACVLGCYIARAMSGDLLKRFFGGFLIILSVFQLVTELKNIKKQN
ncbi:MAG: sulfite exporter TauE/SafE family protein [Clostridia bacterium]|nr:sulfite exporter TauE/SafE family protein [Clostridia bacterium]